MQRILVTRQLPEKYLRSLQSQLGQQQTEIVSWPSAKEPAERDFLASKMAGAHGVLCMLTDNIDSELLAASGKQLRCVSTMSVGVDHIDTAACRRLGVRVGYTPGVLTEATADLALALLLATARRLPEALAAVKNGEWGPWAPYEMCGRGLYDSVVGIVGLGRIGQAVARRISGFSPRRLLHCGRRPKPDAERSLGCEFVSFEELLGLSDFVVVCCPANSDTVGMFNGDAFSRMRPTSALINVSRGSVVDQKALHLALTDGRIGAAGLDVTDPEPLPTDSPLLRLSNCVVLPHIGSADPRTRDAMAQLAVDNLVAALRGHSMPAELTA